MDENNKNGGYDKLFAFIAIGLEAAGAIALGLSFTILGIYSLIASMLLEIVAVTFINLQKRKNRLKWLDYIKFAAYALFIAALLLFVANTVWPQE